MKTNFQGILEIEKHYLNPENKIRWGLIVERETNLIKSELSLEEKDLTQLQDARDFVVAYVTNNILSQEINKTVNVSKQRILQDMMSAITYTIDCEKMKKGGNV